MTDFQPPIVNVPIYNPNYFITQGESSVSSLQFVQFPVETRTQTFSNFTLENVVLGNGACGTALNSVAIGKNATSNFNNATAIGKDAVAPSANSVCLGNPTNFFSFGGMGFQNYVNCSLVNNFNVPSQNSLRNITWGNISTNTIFDTTDSTNFINITGKSLTVIISYCNSIDAPLSNFIQMAVIGYSAGGTLMRNMKKTNTAAQARTTNVCGIIHSLNDGESFSAQYVYQRISLSSNNTAIMIGNETFMNILVF